MANLALWEDCGKAEIPLTFSISILQRKKFIKRGTEFSVCVPFG
jgi:hypothetical protein